MQPILDACEADWLEIDTAITSFVFADPIVVDAGPGGFPPWQRALFAWLQRNSRKLATDLEIPINRRVEVSVEAAV